MTLLLQNLVNGLVLGGLYACIAVGFSLVWGVLNIINMLHGSLIVLGGYIAYLAFAQLGISSIADAALVVAADVRSRLRAAALSSSTASSTSRC